MSCGGYPCNPAPPCSPYNGYGYAFGYGAGYGTTFNGWRPGCYTGYGAPGYLGCGPCSGYVPLPDYYRRFY